MIQQIPAQQIPDCLSRSWSCIKVALTIRAAQTAQPFVMLERFNPLTDDVQLERLGQTDHRTNDFTVALVLDAAQKRLVDFQCLNRQALQVRQARGILPPTARMAR